MPFKCVLLTNRSIKAIFTQPKRVSACSIDRASRTRTFTDHQLSRWASQYRKCQWIKSLSRLNHWHQNFRIIFQPSCDNSGIALDVFSFVQFLCLAEGRWNHLMNSAAKYWTNIHENNEDLLAKNYDKSQNARTWEERQKFWVCACKTWTILHRLNRGMHNWQKLVLDTNKCDIYI